MPVGIYERTKEYKIKHSQDCKGKSGVYVRTEETKEKMRGRTPWNKDTVGVMKANSGSFKKGHKLQCGDKNSNWKGGISVGEYCPLWIDKEFKDYIKERDGWVCQNPLCWGKIDRIMLHHINYNKKDCNLDNLITVCTSCNSRANFNREFWQEHYENIMEDVYG